MIGQEGRPRGEVKSGGQEGRPRGEVPIEEISAHKTQRSKEWNIPYG
jgi:hypothetical protein